MAPSFWTSHEAPASSSTTSAPASHRTLAAIPPPAPEPTMQTSKVFVLVAISIGGASLQGASGLGRRVYRLRAPMGCPGFANALPPLYAGAARFRSEADMVGGRALEIGLGRANAGDMVA